MVEKLLSVCARFEEKYFVERISLACPENDVMPMGFQAITGDFELLPQIQSIRLMTFKPPTRQFVDPNPYSVETHKCFPHLVLIKLFHHANRLHSSVVRTLSSGNASTSVAMALPTRCLEGCSIVPKVAAVS